MLGMQKTNKQMKRLHPKEPTFSLEGKTDKEVGVENGAF